MPNYIRMFAIFCIMFFLNYLCPRLIRSRALRGRKLRSTGLIFTLAAALSKSNMLRLVTNIHNNFIMDLICKRVWKEFMLLCLVMFASSWKRIMWPDRVCVFLQPTRLNVFKNDQDTWDYTNPSPGEGKTHTHTHECCEIFMFDLVPHWRTIGFLTTW